MNHENKNWFVLYTKPRQEFKAAAQLEQHKIEHYLPTIKKIKQWSDRKKKIIEPIFRGYIFIYSTEKERLISLEQPSIVKSVMFEGKPAIIHQTEIENIKKMLSETNDIVVVNRIEKGSKVKVVAGPFQGVSGVVILNSHNQQILSVSIEMMNRSIRVTLPYDSVIKYI
ncbi:UpxY family transcription antiterminator [Melioribacteraceae bacterium 4301-Me]|uniref:UpxY family transcription antiterminator n=1 Tax=Pyranulibacter aquaticus TaxID=3163344 RepID=UPI00359B20DF